MFERFICVFGRLITCPFKTPLSIGEIRDVMSDYLVVFHCDIQRHDICGFVIEGFEISDVDNVLVMSDDVTDGLNIVYISPLDVGYFIESPPPVNVLVGAFFPLWSVGTLVIRNPPSSKWLVGMGPCQAPPHLLSHY